MCVTAAAIRPELAAACAGKPCTVSTVFFPTVSARLGTWAA